MEAAFMLAEKLSNQLLFVSNEISSNVTFRNFLQRRLFCFVCIHCAHCSAKNALLCIFYLTSKNTSVNVNFRQYSQINADSTNPIPLSVCLKAIC